MDLVKDFSDKKGRLATVRAVKHHLQYLAQLKSINEGRGISLVSDTGMCVDCHTCNTDMFVRRHILSDLMTHTKEWEAS